MEQTRPMNLVGGIAATAARARERRAGSVQLTGPKIVAEHFNFYYGAFQALADISLEFPALQVVGIIGPSGCGKSTLLRAINRMHDRTPGARGEGRLTLDGQEIYAAATDPIQIRRRVGMVFQRPNPFASSIYANVAYGLRLNGVRSRQQLDERVEHALRRAALWDEVKDRLHRDSGTALSGGQQQRLCIARAIATEPEVLLMDEPCSALDPIATLKIEELIDQLRAQFTIVMVTHNMQQAARVSDMTVFMLMDEKTRAGRVIEVAATAQLFTSPGDARTEAYISGRFG
ncbi:MAG: phosphate ABC transporter ATP-binding protein [Chloroflexi bacterium]|nr:phosphate ABC transporter ATP-binding protein [Chloroflexota bacterium]